MHRCGSCSMGDLMMTTCGANSHGSAYTLQPCATLWQQWLQWSSAAERELTHLYGLPETAICNRGCGIAKKQVSLAEDRALEVKARWQPRTIALKQVVHHLVLCTRPTLGMMDKLHAIIQEIPSLDSGLFDSFVRGSLCGCA
eukprot:3533412-Amphidinium_carterae.2